MIKYSIKKLNKQDKTDILHILDSYIDLYSDMYITRDNLRLMIKNNKNLFLECLEKGDKLVWEEDKGILFVTGFSDKAKRIYVRPLCKDKESANKLIEHLNWKLPEYDLWIKIKKVNPIKNILLKKWNHYNYIASRGKEILLCRPKLTSEEGIR